MLTFQDDSVLRSEIVSEPAARMHPKSPAYSELWAHWTRSDNGEVVLSPGYLIAVDHDTLIAGVCFGQMFAEFLEVRPVQTADIFSQCWPTLVSVIINSVEENYGAPCLLRVPDADLPENSPESTWVMFVGTVVQRRPGTDDPAFEAIAYERLLQVVDTSVQLWSQVQSTPAPSKGRMAVRSFLGERRRYNESPLGKATSATRTLLDIARTFTGT